MKTGLASVQWLFFIFANTVVVPISIGYAFSLPADTVAGIMRSSLIFTGIACMLQGLVGHRYPLMEGHSGLMWGLILNLSLSATAMGISYTEVGGGIATGMLLAGAVVLLLSLLRWLHFIQWLFTPMVMSVYLFLLTFQLMFIFFDGMLAYTTEGILNWPVSLFSFGVAFLVGFLKIKGGQTVGNFAILIGMLVGWILYGFIFPVESSASAAATALPIFPLGQPNWNVSIILITFVASMINLSNTIASIQAASKLLQEKATAKQYRRSYVLSGCFSIGASVFGLVPYAPFASSIGFLESTRFVDRKPFLIGGGLMALLGIVPILGLILTTLPITVGNAVLFMAYLQLLGTSLKSLNGYVFDSVTIHRLATPVLVGICIMNVDMTIFNQVPALLQPLVSNGFIMGVLISVVLEKLVKWHSRTDASNQTQEMQQNNSKIQERQER